MGIYDREYYRGEPGGPSWFGGVAPWCKTLIVINCAVFLLQNAIGKDSPLFRDWLAASPEEIFQHGRIWQLWTATFLHDGILHILANMWFLWLVGREMESLYGSRDFLAFYLLAAGVSTLGWALIAALSGHMDVPMVGASGAVMAVVTLYTLFYPRREILFFFLPMPMWAVLGIYLVFPLFGDNGSSGVPGPSDGRGIRVLLQAIRPPLVAASHGANPPSPTAHLHAHAGRSTTNPPAWLEPYGRRKPCAKPSSVTVLPEEQLDARLDEVLAKIAREGRGGLTEEDHRVLQEASRRARDKRSDRL